MINLTFINLQESEFHQYEEYKDMSIFIIKHINNSFKLVHFTASNNLAIITCLPNAGKHFF